MNWLLDSNILIDYLNGVDAAADVLGKAEATSISRGFMCHTEFSSHDAAVLARQPGAGSNALKGGYSAARLTATRYQTFMIEPIESNH